MKYLLIILFLVGCQPNRLQMCLDACASQNKQVEHFYIDDTGHAYCECGKDKICP